MKFIPFFILYMHYIECAKILGLFYFPGKSQYMAGVALLKILAEKGHNVTMVSPFGEEKPPENYRDIILDDIAEKAEELIEIEFKFSHHYLQTYMVSTIFFPLINSTLSNPKLRKILGSEIFDLIIIEQFYSDGLAYIAHYLDVPLILYSSIDASSWTNTIVGNPAFPSYIPDQLLGYNSEMTFLQRLDNSIMCIINELIRNFIVLPAHNKMVKQNFPNAPHISVYQQKSSLVFLNGHPSINQAVPKVPAMIDIGGFHIRPPKDLPKELEILDSAEKGVILFSMGSILESANMPNTTIKAFLGAFSELKQTILWKWEGQAPPGIPQNIVIRKWLPQIDVLAHRNIKLFITHGGIHSIQEAVYHGVPCLIIPIFGDQQWNSRRATDAGYARSIQFKDITKEALLQNIDDLLHDSRYTETAKKRSILMKDRITSPADTVNYWVEYVIRHKGADHLRVGALKIHWYQYLLLDVVAFSFFSIFLIYILMKYLTKYCIKILKKKWRKQKFE